jgi:hypothetical protein
MNKDLEFVIAQLRHAYTHLNEERVVQQKMLANGILSPCIQKLERMMNEKV